MVEAFTITYAISGYNH